MFLLVIFLFTVNPATGQPQNAQVATEAFVSLEDCNLAGRHLRELVEIPDNIKTMSYCVRPEDYRS